MAYGVMNSKQNYMTVRSNKTRRWQT